MTETDRSALLNKMWIFTHGLESLSFSKLIEKTSQEDIVATLPDMVGIVITLTLCQILFTCSASLAHHTGGHSVTLHTNNKWEDCAIVLDPSLTQSDFKAFAGEISELIYFRPLAGARPLSNFNFEIAIESRAAEIEDWKPKWNNTFSHPDSMHTLVGDNHILTVPGLRGSRCKITY